METLEQKYAKKLEARDAAKVADKVEEKSVETKVEAKVEASVAKEEPKVEAKVEAKVEEKPELSKDITDEVESLITSIIKPTEKKEEGKPEVKTEIPEEYKAYAETHNLVESNPTLKDIFEYVKNGGNIEELLESTAGVIDYEKMSDDEVFVMANAELNYSPDEMKEALSDFKEKKEYQKKAELSSMRKQLKDKKPVMNGKVKEILAKSIPVLQEKKHKIALTKSEARNVLKSEVEKLNDFKGIYISAEDKKDIYMLSELHTNEVSTKDGLKYDTETGIKAAIYIKYGDAILNKVREDALREGALAFAKKRFGPNASDGSATAAPTEQKKERSAEIKDAIKKQTGR